MKKILLYLSLVVLLLTVSLTDCKKKPELKVYSLELSNESVVATNANASIVADYSFPTEIRDIKVVVSENSNLQNARVIDANLHNNTLSATVDNLSASTKYYYSFRYSNGMSIADTDKRSFTTLPLSEYAIVLLSNPSDGGTVSGGGSYQYGASCTVYATANSGYTFTNWTENGSQVSTNVNYTFTVNGNRSLVANFTYNGGGNAPTGAINGLFTINANGDQVYFSQGNLQYQASTDIWRFATNQWDYVGEDNANISSTYSGWIDLFGWGTSGWNNGNTYYHPWDSNNSDGSLYGPPGYYNLNGDYANADWGVYNPISNGGNTANQWRTLTQPEWDYIFNTRITFSGIRYAKARVNNVNGVILLPDDWSSSTYSLSNTNTDNASFSSNTISASQWSALEQAGAVFLPAAGYRSGASVVSVGSGGNYWSASWYSSDLAYYVGFYDSYLNTRSVRRFCGLSVRLVQDAE